MRIISIIIIVAGREILVVRATRSSMPAFRMARQYVMNIGSFGLKYWTMRQSGLSIGTLEEIYQARCLAGANDHNHAKRKWWKRKSRRSPKIDAEDSRRATIASMAKCCPADVAMECAAEAGRQRDGFLNNRSFPPCLDGRFSVIG